MSTRSTRQSQAAQVLLANQNNLAHSHSQNGIQSGNTTRVLFLSSYVAELYLNRIISVFS